VSQHMPDHYLADFTCQSGGRVATHVGQHEHRGLGMRRQPQQCGVPVDPAVMTQDPS
jgi:hypothetical protein